MPDDLARLRAACRDALLLWDRGESIGPDQAEVDAIRAALACLVPRERAPSPCPTCGQPGEAVGDGGVMECRACRLQWVDL